MQLTSIEVCALFMFDLAVVMFSHCLNHCAFQFNMSTNYPAYRYF